MVEEVDVEVGGGVITEVVTRMVTRATTGVEGASLELEVVASLGEDGVEVVW